MKAAAVLAVLLCAASAYAEEPAPPAPPPAEEKPKEPTLLERAREAVKAGDMGAAEAYLTPWVKEHPADLEAATLRARVLGWLGRHDEALLAFDRVLAKVPDDVDVLLGKSFVHWFAGRSAEARPPLEKILRKAPDYLDAWKLYIRVLGDVGDFPARDRAVAEASKRFPGKEREILSGPAGGQETGPPGRGELEAGYRYDRLSGDNDDWTEQYVEGLFRYGWPRGPTPLSPRETLYVRARRASRYGEEDAGVSALLTAPVDRMWTGALGAEVNPGAEFLPRLRGDAEVSRPLGDGYAAAAGVFRTVYEDDTVQGGWARLEKYAGPWRIAAQGTGSYLVGEEWVFGGRLSVDRSYGYQDRSLLGASLNFGREIESVPAGVRIDNVVGGSVYVRHWLTDRWALTGEIGVQRQGSLYTRTGILFGVRYSF